jgi:hypothetical protein
LQRDERRRTHFHLSVFEIVPFPRVVDKRLVQAKLSQNLREEIYQQFKEAVYAGSEEKINEVEEYLCGLGNQIIQLTGNLYFKKGIF